jgi:addiction module HigA family antidote
MEVKSAMGQSSAFKIESLSLESVSKPSKLLSELMEKYELNEAQVSEGAGISKSLVSLILQDHRRITDVTALRLARFFNVSPLEFIQAQTVYDLAEARNELGKKLDKIKPITKSTQMKNRDKETNKSNIL